MNRQKIYANDGLWSFTLREMQRFALSPKFWAIMIVVTLILGISGPFSTLKKLDTVPRFAYWGAICVFTFFANLAAVLPIIYALRDTSIPSWATYALAGIAGSIPITCVVWFINVYLSRISDPTLVELIDLWAKCAPIAIAITLSNLVFRSDARNTANNNDKAQVNIEPVFFARLPISLGKDIYALQAQDHYVQVTTARGKDMILLRLEDAVRELDGIDGLRVHRSWWVAKSAVTNLDRENGKLILLLEDGSSVPVSRTYAKMVREAFAGI